MERSLLWIMILMPMLAGIVAYCIGKKNETVRDWFADGVVVLEFVLSVIIYSKVAAKNVAVTAGVKDFAGLGIYLWADGFRALYAMISSFAWMVACLFAREYLKHDEHRNRFYLFMLLTLGATVGVFVSADFYTLFLFFEMMSLTSYVWVAQEEDAKALRAAGTYLAVAVIGGLVMLMGIFMLNSLTQTLVIDELSTACKVILASEDRILIRKLYIAGACMLFGFGAKAGAFPLHIWLPKAHPVAPAPFSALLSGILTKAGMFGILVLAAKVFFAEVRWGSLVMLIGVCTMLIGAILAIFSVDLKRTLACSSVSQIGFILVGVGVYNLLGEEGTVAISGSLLHMVNHSMFKLVLFASAGVVFMNLHKLNLNDIRGFGRKKPLLCLIFGLGSLGIMCVPGFSGYISKTLIHEGIVEYANLINAGVLEAGIFGFKAVKTIEYLFLFSGGCTVCYMIKLFVCIFIEKNSDDRIQRVFDSLEGRYMSNFTGILLLIPACMFFVLGITPSITMNTIAYTCRDLLYNERLSVSYYSFENLKGSAISIIIGILLYLLVRKWLIHNDSGENVYTDRWPHWLDLEDGVYRPILLKALPAFFGFFCRILDSFVDTIVVILRKTVYKDSGIPHELEEGNIFTYALGRMADNHVAFANKTFAKKKPKPVVDHTHIYAMKYSKISEESNIVTRSMSFGLFLFCVGLFITIGYILLTT